MLLLQTQSVLSILLHPDQHGFVPGRGVREALRRFLDLQHLCTRLPSLKYAGAIFLDFAKAFDSVDHSALHSTLSHFGFGPNFSQWIRTFYSDNITTTIINGSPGSFFQLGSGVRQGDPLSPGLFVVYIEPLLSFLRSTLHQHGIITPIHTSSHLTLAFADDVTGLLADLRHAPTFIAHVNSFCSAVGMALNLTKMVVLPFTSWDITHPTRAILQHHHLRTLDPTDFTRLLGVVGDPTSTSHQLALLLRTIHQRMVLWRWRARTYRGRVLLLKTVILPLLWHVGTAHYNPETFLAKLSILVRSFINKNITGVHSYRSPPGLLPLTWHAIPRSQGGLSLPSPVDTLRSYRLSVLISGLVAIRSTPLSAPHWFTPALCLFTLSLRHLGLGLNILYLPHVPSAKMDSKRWVDLPPFWIDTLRTWTTLVRTSWDTNTRSPTQLVHQPLWNNGTLLRGASRLPVFRTITSVQHLGLASIHRLGDLLSTAGTFPTSDTFKALLAPHLHRPIKAATALLDTIRLLGLPPSLPAVFPTVPTYLLGAFDLQLCQPHPPHSHPYSSILIHHSPTASPILPLGITPDFSVSDTFWSTQDSYHRRVLPVIVDLVYRLRHNALGCRYGYRWRTTTPPNPLHAYLAVQLMKHHVIFSGPALWQLNFGPFTSRCFNDYMVLQSHGPGSCLMIKLNSDLRPLLHLVLHSFLRLLLVSEDVFSTSYGFTETPSYINQAHPITLFPSSSKQNHSCSHISANFRTVWLTLTQSFPTPNFSTHTALPIFPSVLSIPHLSFSRSLALHKFLYFLLLHSY